MRAVDCRAVDGEMNAWIPELRADDGVFDLVESERVATGDKRALAEERLEAADIGYAVDGVGIDYTGEDESIVSVDPIGQFVSRCRESRRVVSGTHGAYAVDIAVEVVTGGGESSIVDATTRVDPGAQRKVEEAMRESRFRCRNRGCCLSVGWLPLEPIEDGEQKRQLREGDTTKRLG